MPDEKIDWTKRQPPAFVEQTIALQVADTWLRKPSDLSKLVLLLRSDANLTQYCRRGIADLLDRHRLVRKQGRPRPPSYVEAATTPQEMRKALVTAQVPRRRGGDSAVERASFAAVAAADTWRSKQSDPYDLIALLRSDTELTPYGRERFADLLERHQLVRNRGRPPPPIHGSTLAEAVLEIGGKLVRSFMRDGLSYDNALNAVSEELDGGEFSEELQGLDIDKLDAAMKGQRGSTRRRHARKHRD